jgi:hypothetical protein
VSAGAPSPYLVVQIRIHAFEGPVLRPHDATSCGTFREFAAYLSLSGRTVERNSLSGSPVTMVGPTARAVADR